MRKSCLHGALKDEQNLVRPSGLAMEGPSGVMRGPQRKGRRQRASEEGNVREDRWRDSHLWG